MSGSTTAPRAAGVPLEDHAGAPASVARRLPLPITVLALAAGGAAWLADAGELADLAFAVATIVAFVPALVRTIREVVHGHLGVDVIALLAMVGALALGELLAGAIIAVMLTGGEALEAHAAGRARRELTALLQRAPRTAHLRTPDGDLIDVDVDEVTVGAHLLVKPGEVVPTDGALLSDRAVLDTSALTGEARPVEVRKGNLLTSGTINAASPIELRATAVARDSTYAGIVRLVEQAATERAPFVRLADRYAAWFLPITLVLAGVAWLLAGDPIRALAVLVVATPCPLILAAPAAIVGGLSNAARHGIIIKGGGALEALASSEVVLLDKTGTVTAGRPSVARVHTVDGVTTDEVLRVAGSLEQVSVHPFASVVVAAAVERGLSLTLPDDAREELGVGITGTVAGVEVRVGQARYVSDGGPLPAPLRRVARRSLAEGSSTVHVSAAGRVLGTLILTDALRAEAPSALRSLRAAGIRQVLLVTGDRTDVAELVAETLGVDRVLAERDPHEKVAAVREARRLGRTIMVGDGVNDAPALAVADVGVAMGARGATAASEAADVVLTADRISGLADAVRIARRSRRIARQSVTAGMGLSIAAMFVAASGNLAPVAGALVQEGIDVAVILNALRALRRPGRAARRVPTVPAEVLADHRGLARGLDHLSTVADELPDLDEDEARDQVERVRRFLVDELLPHELDEERRVYPALAQLFDGQDPTAPLARSHREIARRVRLFDRLVSELPETGAELFRV
ncbi:heavy metal translocating P-type ATPase [Nitriliruptoraceae bacterium ZYF776]|nr:heavy metal translocating P-type ATPase [Profundirhabdus halotolerans]